MIYSTTAFKVFFVFAIPACIWLFIDIESCLAVLAPPENRELGIIELSQVAVLIATILICYRQMLSSKGAVKHQIIWVFLCLFLLFVTLEEIDYGLHYYEYLTDKSFYSANFNGFRNIHNHAGNMKIIQIGAFLLQTVLFGFLPFLRITIGSKAFKPVFGYFYWSIWLLWTIILFFKTYLSESELTILSEAQFAGELRELAIYILLYTFLDSFKSDLIPFTQERKILSLKN